MHYALYNVNRLYHLLVVWYIVRKQKKNYIREKMRSINHFVDDTTNNDTNLIETILAKKKNRIE